MMQGSLQKGLSKILDTVETVFVSYEDKKIVVSEWLKIGMSGVGWVWIFKHLPEISEDMQTAEEEEFKTMMEVLKSEFDIPQDTIEVVIEHALSIILNFLAMLDLKAKNGGGLAVTSWLEDKNVSIS